MWQWGRVRGLVILILSAVVIGGCAVDLPSSSLSSTYCSGSDDYTCRYCYEAYPRSEEFCTLFTGNPPLGQFPKRDHAAVDTFCNSAQGQNDAGCRYRVNCQGSKTRLSCAEAEAGLAFGLGLASLLKADSTNDGPVLEARAVHAASATPDERAAAAVSLSGLTEFPLTGIVPHPAGIVGGPDGNLWVTVPNFNEVQRVSPAGVVTRFNLSDDDSLPFAIAAGPDGNLWLAENKGSRVARITPAGVQTSFYYTGGGRPSVITSGPDGNLWFTAVSSFFAGAIAKVTPAGVFTTFPLPDSAPAAPKVPLFIVPGPDGNLWFTLGAAGKIGRITTEGVITEFDLPSADAGPVGIAAGPDGNLWFTEFGAGAIGRITPAGDVTEFPLANPDAEPFSIAAGPDGNLWFTEVAAGKLGRITPDGVITEFDLPTSDAGPMVIGQGPGGELWLTESRAGRIARVDTAATESGEAAEVLAVEHALPVFSSGPTDITVGPDGNLWFIEANRSHIVRMTPGGEQTEFPVVPFGDQVTLLVALTTGPDGNLWFTDSAQPPHIGRITTSGEVTLFLAPPPPEGSFWPVTPTDITAGSDGNLYFTDYQGTRIGRVTTSGEMTLIPIVAEDLGGSVLPAGITTGPDGNLWFADANNGAIFRMTPGGVFTPFRLDAGSSATGITTGPDGALWFTASNTVGWITTAGVVTDELTVPGFAFANLTGITTGPDGALWVTSQTTSRLLRVETSGEMQEFPLDALAQPISIVTGPDNALWFTEPGINKVGRLDPGEALPPEPPAGEWLTATELKGFRAKVQITGATTTFAGKKVEDCIEDTLCVSGALPGQPEIFVRVVGPKPNGKLWPTLVKFSTSQAEVWIEQIDSGVVRYYKLRAVDPGASILNLAGVADKEGFNPEAAFVASSDGMRSIVVPWSAQSPSSPPEVDPAPPAGPWLTTEELEGFQVKVRVTGTAPINGTKVDECIANTLCVSGALPGRPEVFVRIVGPKPNGMLWPTLVKFSTSQNEIWIEQLATGVVRYYDLPAVQPGAEILDLAGLADKLGFSP